VTADSAGLLQRFDLTPAQAEPLAVLLDLLALPEAPTSIHDHRRAVDVHIADSLAGLAIADLREAHRIADVGAGAGLPGLVLAALLPDARVTLVESARRKCEFIRHAARAMRLGNAEVVWARAEEWSDGLGRCDAVCARALASIPVLCEYAAPLLRIGGTLVAWKGRRDADEEAELERAAPRVGVWPLEIRAAGAEAGYQHRHLHLLQKRGATPPGLPRRPGMAKKRPFGRRDAV
jgi:16S rRNA (guanine527-N7)-methyltransferase